MNPLDLGPEAEFRFVAGSFEFGHHVLHTGLGINHRLVVEGRADLLHDEGKHELRLQVTDLGIQMLIEVAFDRSDQLFLFLLG